MRWRQSCACEEPQGVTPVTEVLERVMERYHSWYLRSKLKLQNPMVYHDFTYKCVNTCGIWIYPISGRDTPISYFGRQVFAENRRRSRGEEGPADWKALRCHGSRGLFGSMISPLKIVIVHSGIFPEGRSGIGCVYIYIILNYIILYYILYIYIFFCIHRIWPMLINFVHDHGRFHQLQAETAGNLARPDLGRTWELERWMIPLNWWDFTCFYSCITRRLPSGYVKIAIENGPVEIISGFSHEKWWCSIVMLVYQRLTVNWWVFHIPIYLFITSICCCFFYTSQVGADVVLIWCEGRYLHWNDDPNWQTSHPLPS